MTENEAREAIASGIAPLTAAPRESRSTVSPLDGVHFSINCQEKRQDNCTAVPSQPQHRNTHSLTAVSSDATLIALQEDVVRLEKSIVQRKQHQQETQQQQLTDRMQNLHEQADRINALAAQLAAEMVKFQEMAQQVNRDCRALHSPEKKPEIPLSAAKKHAIQSAPVWEIQSIAIPTIVKRDFQFVLTAIKVEKPGSEEEDAAQRAAKAQQRREALERWLEARRQKIVDKFSGL